MHELTVSLKGLNQDQLEKLQDVYYHLGCLIEGEKYFDLLAYGAETLTNRSRQSDSKSTIYWSRGVNYTPTHTYEEALALVAPNSLMTTKN